MKAVLTDQILIRKGKIWTVRPRTGHVAIFQASARKASRAEALIAVAGLVAAAASEEGTALVAVASVAAALDALADSAVAGLGADGKN